MRTRTSVIIILLLVAISVAAGVYLYPQLPDRVASHWNTEGVVDGYMPKFWGVFLLPIVALGILLLFLAIPKIDPLRKNIEAFRPYYNTFITIIILFLLYIHVISLAWNLGYRFNMTNAIVPVIGILIFYLGVFLRHAKRNWFIGIRTPWTLSSDRVWEKTHTLGSTLFKISGAIAILGILFQEYAFWLLLVPIIGTTLYLLVYSYIEYKKEQNATTPTS